jgi:hypothetical protein
MEKKGSYRGLRKIFKTLKKVAITVTMKDVKDTEGKGCYRCH